VTGDVRVCAVWRVGRVWGMWRVGVYGRWSVVHRQTADSETAKRSVSHPTAARHGKNVMQSVDKEIL